MPILTIQKRMTEVGRIRMGEKVASGKGSRPKRLEHFRLTSHDRRVLDSAAAVYGGAVRPWQSDAGPQFQLVIEADHLDVLIAPGESFSQWFELWTGGGCARRCDGLTLETLDGKDVRDRGVGCMCPKDVAERVEMAADGAACKPTTRLSVWLPQLAGIGVWRAETHGFYAAAELPNVVGLLQGLAAQGYRPMGTLRMGTRTVKRPGSPTKTFPVLELDLPDVTLSGLLSEGAALPGEATLIGPGAVPEVRQIGPGEEPPHSGRRPPPRERVARPGNGTPVDLPAGSDMRKPAAAMPASRVEPNSLPFDVDEGDSAAETAQDAQRPTNGADVQPALDLGSTPGAAAASAAVEAMTLAEFGARVSAEHLTQSVAPARRRLFGPEREQGDLAPAELGRLYAAIKRPVQV